MGENGLKKKCLARRSWAWHCRDRKPSVRFIGCSNGQFNAATMCWRRRWITASVVPARVGWSLKSITLKLSTAVPSLRVEGCQERWSHFLSSRLAALGRCRVQPHLLFMYPLLPSNACTIMRIDALQQSKSVRLKYYGAVSDPRSGQYRLGFNNLRPASQTFNSRPVCCIREG